VALSGKHVPHFKPGKDLRERVNDGATGRSATERGAPAARPDIVSQVFELPPLLLALAFVLVGLAPIFSAAVTAQHAPCACHATTTSASTISSTTVSTTPRRSSPAWRRPTAMPPRSSSRSGACSGAAARSIGDRHPFAPARSRRTGLRDKAAFALALDYQSAGLMDRAERVLEELAASREYRHAALDTS